MEETTLTVALLRDIPTAIRDLDGVRTPKNRDAIVWAQYVLTACVEVIKSIAGKEVAI